MPRAGLCLTQLTNPISGSHPVLADPHDFDGRVAVHCRRPWHRACRLRVRAQYASQIRNERPCPDRRFAADHWRPLARRAPFYVFGTAGIFTDHYASERICEVRILRSSARCLDASCLADACGVQMQLAAWKKLPPAERAAADRARNDAIARATGSQPQQQQQQQKPALPPLASTPTVASGGSGSGSSGGGSGAGGGDAKPKS